MVVVEMLRIGGEFFYSKSLLNYFFVYEFFISLGKDNKWLLEEINVFKSDYLLLIF